MWNRLKEGLSKTSQKLCQGFASLFNSSTMSANQLEEISEILIMADLGMPVVDILMKHIKHSHCSEMEMRQKLAEQITLLLLPYEKLLRPPDILIAVGVNGAGKTTTLGKLGWKWQKQGLKVRLIAADTFRAAAVEQLSLWGGGMQITSGGKDPASVVFKGIKEAQQDQDHVILIDTAGRLPNKTSLMDELAKIHGVVNRLSPASSCEIVLILDATIGQHALIQVELFQKSIPLTGIIINKMDGTAKGGILVNIAQTYKIPIYGLGLGERAEDFCDFKAKDFADGLVGL